jgi:two-component system chemotaxis response regulator CheB
MNELPADVRIIVIGASSGGLEAIRSIIKKLPRDFKSPIFIVWHISPENRSLLPEILNQSKTIPAAHAIDKEPIQAGRIYIAPPDKHLIIEKDIVRVTQGPKENRFRPAIDALFRSAANTYLNRVVGVVLSGALDDGTAGLWSIKRRGGISIVQEPWEAAVSSMPENAIEAVQIDYRLPASAMADLLIEISNQQQMGNISNKSKLPAQEDKQTNLEVKIALDERIPDELVFSLGELSRHTCPECHGVLTAIKEGYNTRFRCHTGHAYSAESLLLSLHETIDNNLWSALRGMEETIFLLNYMGDHFSAINKPKLGSFYFRKAKETAGRVQLLKQAIHLNEPIATDAATIGL